MVKIADLKAHLSAHLKRVRAGEEVLVCDREEPIARIVPVDVSGYSERDRRLIARGLMIPPMKRRPANFKWPRPSGRLVTDEVMEQVWREERDAR